MNLSVIDYMLMIYIAFTLRILFEQVYFGYLLYTRRALPIVPYVYACTLNLIRWPYLAACYPKLFVAEFIVGKKLARKTAPKTAASQKNLSQTGDRNCD